MRARTRSYSPLLTLHCATIPACICWPCKRPRSSRESPRMTATNGKSAPWEAYLVENEDAFFNDLVELLRIPSISTSQEHNAETARAADWVANRLRQAGFRRSIRHRIWSSHRPWRMDRRSGKPRVLIYGHYDVQPPEPLDSGIRPPLSRPSATASSTRAARAT